MELNQLKEEVLCKISENSILMRPKLQKDKIDSFEALYNVQLPREYVVFLTEIGDGWERTDNGRFFTAPMNELDHSFQQPENISKTFPFTKEWIWEEDDDESIFPKMINESESEYEQRISGLLDATAYGHLRLIDLGDGAGWDLIITGPSKGQMWFICGEGMMPCNPRLEFLQWAKKWLNGEKDLTNYT